MLLLSTLLLAQSIMGKVKDKYTSIYYRIISRVLACNHVSQTDEPPPPPPLSLQQGKQARKVAEDMKK